MRVILKAHLSTLWGGNRKLKMSTVTRKQLGIRMFTMYRIGLRLKTILRGDTGPINFQPDFSQIFDSYYVYFPFVDAKGTGTCFWVKSDVQCHENAGFIKCLEWCNIFTFTLWYNYNIYKELTNSEMYYKHPLVRCGTNRKCNFHFNKSKLIQLWDRYWYEYYIC